VSDFGFHFDFPHSATVIFCRNFWGKFTGVLFFFISGENMGMNESAKVAHHDASVVFTQK
jgi:hypothetical protein